MVNDRMIMPGCLTGMEVMCYDSGAMGGRGDEEELEEAGAGNPNTWMGNFEIINYCRILSSLLFIMAVSGNDTSRRLG